MILKRQSTKVIGLFSAVALGVSSMVGSGWLFAPYNSLTIAGPAALLSWAVGAAIVTLLGLCFAEIAALYPRRGLSAIIPSLSHNIYFAFPFAIANWLGIVAVIALEADATTQYLINLLPHLKPLFFVDNHLTLLGDGFSIILVFLFTLANYWGARAMVRTNNILTIIKLIVPIFISVIVICTAFHPANFTAYHHTMSPYGIEAIFTAILTTGIVVAFNGFQTVISFANEIKRPYITIPLSIIIAVFISLLIYLFIQVAFIGATPTSLVEKGWSHLKYSAPVVQIMGLIGLGVFSTAAYIGATVAPLGTATAFTGTATRMFTAMSQNKQMPKYFRKIHPAYNFSRRALIMNAILAVVFLLLFKSWSDLAEVIGLFHIVSYLPVPLALWVLRKKISRKKYLFRMPLGRSISLILFVFFGYLFGQAKLTIAIELMSIFLIFLLIFMIVSSINKQATISEMLKEIWTLLVYFASLIIISIFSPQNSHLLSELQFIALVTILNVACFFLMLKAERSDVAIVKSSVYMYSRHE